jgi:hypothetical protein
MGPDLAVTLSQRRWSCILDPALLLLTRFGPMLVQRLGALVELWLARTFWRVLDDSETCLQRPDRLVPAGWLPNAGGGFASASSDSLRVWERIRARTDLCGLRFRYVGDNLMSSALPDQREPDLLQRFESLESALLARLGEWPHGEPEGYDAWLGAVDALALAGTLGSVCVLTLHDPERRQPALAAALERFDGAPTFVASGDDLMEYEREQINRLLVQAGAAPLVWSGLDLAVAHVVAPRALQMRTAFDDMVQDADEEFSPADPAEDDPWGGALVHWYAL